MQENDLTTQSEKRGRFLIQEIEEDIEQVHKNYFSEKNVNLITNNYSKRTKHSSMTTDSKIFHTTRTDSNLSNILFSTFINEINRKDWVDFNTLWKEFSKFHTDVMDYDMEKIFHYIDKKIDDSDFQYLNTNSSLVKFKTDERFKLISDNDIIAENKNLTIEETIKQQTVNISKISNDTKKIKINFCGDPVCSPAISPISSNSNLLDFEINKYESYDKVIQNDYFTRSDYKTFKKEIKSNLKIEMIAQFTLNNKNKILNPDYKKELKLMKNDFEKCNEKNFQIYNTKNCYICKDILKD